MTRFTDAPPFALQFFGYAGKFYAAPDGTARVVARTPTVRIRLAKLQKFKSRDSQTDPFAALFVLPDLSRTLSDPD